MELNNRLVIVNTKYWKDNPAIFQGIISRLSSFKSWSGNGSDNFQFDLTFPENKIVMLLKVPVSSLELVQPNNIIGVSRLDVILNVCSFNSVFYDSFNGNGYSLVSCFLEEIHNYLLSSIRKLVPNNYMAANRVGFYIYTELPSSATNNREMENMLKTLGFSSYQRNSSVDWLNNNVNKPSNIYRYRFNFNNRYETERLPVKGYNDNETNKSSLIWPSSSFGGAPPTTSSFSSSASMLNSNFNPNPSSFNWVGTSKKPPSSPYSPFTFSSEGGLQKSNSKSNFGF